MLAPLQDPLEERQRRTILEDISETRETALQRKKGKEKGRVRGTSKDGGEGREVLEDRHTVGHKDSAGERLVRRERPEMGEGTRAGNVSWCSWAPCPWRKRILSSSSEESFMCLKRAFLPLKLISEIKFSISKKL